MVMQCLANPASNSTFPLKQPNGTTVEVRQVGNEFFHVIETADGCILQEDILGYYAYADENGNSSGIYAHNASDRSQAEIQFLSSLDQDAIYKKLHGRFLAEEESENSTPKFAKSNMQRLIYVNPKYSQGEVRIPVILVQFADVKFKNENPKAQFNDFLNKEGYNEYYNVGSVRDYFIKNSNGKFRPKFEILGPVTLSEKRASYGGSSWGNNNYSGAVKAVEEAIYLRLDDDVDFSDYDVNFVSIIFAGVSSNGSGVKESIWPHKGNLQNKWVMNRLVNAYSCSSEISSSAYVRDTSTAVLDGIGTFIHEFSHLLGFPDYYDTGKKNEHKTPGFWTVMDVGAYNCPTNPYNVESCAPPLYSAFGRMTMGWLTPTELNTNGLTRLDKLDDNVAYSVTNPNNSDEMFLLEYRTNKGWDAGQWRSGMLIWHIDYDQYIWGNNAVNIDGDHMRIDIIETISETERNGISLMIDAYDPFPGAANVTDFNRFVFWNGRNANIALSSIRESADYEYVSFNVCMNASSCPTIEESSSSVESSSSFEQPFSSSEMELSSSSELWLSSSETIMSSSEELSSSSEMELSSSSELWLSSSETIMSSSEELSSSSEMELSSSSELQLLSSETISSSFEEFLSSSESVSSSSEIVLSSSAIVSSSSIIALSNPSVSSSSAAASSSSIIESTSSNASGSSSDAAEISSSSAMLSSSAVVFSSNSVLEISSSSMTSSSSSESLESSSSEHPVFAVHSTPLSNVRVRMHNGDIYIYAPQQGVKTVRFFSPIGTLLLETTMENSEQAIDLRSISRSNIIVSVTQGNKQLFKGIIRWNR